VAAVNHSSAFVIDDCWSKDGLIAWSCIPNIRPNDARNVNDARFILVYDTWSQRSVPDASSHITIDFFGAAASAYNYSAVIVFDDG
jgi:hypothetical protein